MISKRIYAMLLSCSLLTTQALATEYNYTGYFDIRGKCIQVADDSGVDEPQDAVRKKKVAVEVGNDNKAFTSTNTPPQEISQNAAWFAKEGNDIYIYTKIPSNHAGKKYIIAQQAGVYSTSDEAEIVGNYCRIEYRMDSELQTTTYFYLLEQTGYDVKCIAQLDLTASIEKIDGDLNVTNAQAKEGKGEHEGNFYSIAYTIDVGDVPDGTAYEVESSNRIIQTAYAKAGKINFWEGVVEDAYTIRKLENAIISDDKKHLTIEYIEGNIDEINMMTELPDWYWSVGALYVKKENMDASYQAEIDGRQIEGWSKGAYYQFYCSDVLSQLSVGTYPVTVTMDGEKMNITPKIIVEESNEKPIITKVGDMAVQQDSNFEQYIYPAYLENANNSGIYNEDYLYICDKNINTWINATEKGVLLVNAYTPLTNNIVGKFCKIIQMQDENGNLLYVKSQLSDEVQLSDKKLVLHKDSRGNHLYFCADVERGTALQIGEYSGKIYGYEDLMPILISEVKDGSYPIIVGGEDTGYRVERKSTTYKPKITEIQTSRIEDIWGDSRQYHTLSVPDAKVGDVYWCEAAHNGNEVVVCKEDGKLQIEGWLGNWVQIYKILSYTCQDNQAKLVISSASNQAAPGQA